MPVFWLKNKRSLWDHFLEVQKIYFKMKSASINENKIASSKASKRLTNIGISNTLYTLILYSKNADVVEAIQN